MSIVFGRALVKPSLHREPAYDSGRADAAGERPARFAFVRRGAGSGWDARGLAGVR